MNTSNFFDQVVGIIGGTGPEATNYFTSLLVKMRGPVRSDQDHIPFLLINNPQIPDRSKCILFNGENPLSEMIRTGLLLKNAGASFIVIPCNTAHAFTDELEKHVGLPVMNMVDLTVEHIYRTYGQKATIGLLATDGTIASNIYENAIQKIAPFISLVTPNKKSQNDVMKAIYKIKRFSSDEQSFQLLNNAAEELTQKGACPIVLACTEIPLALPPQKCSFQTIDPMEILAKKVIERTLASKNNFTQFRQAPFPIMVTITNHNPQF